MSETPPSTDPSAAIEPATASSEPEATEIDRQTLPPGAPRSISPKSAGSLVGEWIAQTQQAALPRRSGARAEQAWLRGRLEHARGSSELELERSLSAQLARQLAARGSELDSATRLARRALVLGEDPQLREELSGWFAGLGEPALAAATLRPAVLDRSPAQAALVLTRIAVLQARAGAPESAVDLLREAGQQAPSDPLILELLGAIGGWAPTALPPARAADAYVEGARRRDARGERAAAFEDLLRAFELDATSAIAAELLAQALSARGRGGAADEVMREHATARGPRAESTHLRRLRDALDADDLPRALSAGLDAALDSEMDAEAALRAIEHPDVALRGFDDVLVRAELHELLAARLQLVLERHQGLTRARLALALGRLQSGPLNSPDRAVESWIVALVADPTSEDAKAALRSHAASTRDQAPLVEALVRIAKASESRPPDAADLGAAPRAGAWQAPDGVESCLRELMVMAEQRLSDPTLAAWALERLSALAPDPELDTKREQLRPRARLQREAIDSAELNLEAAGVTGPGARASALRRLAAIIRFHPEAADRSIELLSELCSLEPEERSWRAQLERLLEREGRLEQLTALLEAQLSSASRAESERARLRLSGLARARADEVHALHVLEPLLESGGGYRAAWCTALLLAGRVGAQSVRARALERIAQPLPRAYRTVILCAAADAWGFAGNSQAAWDAAQAAKDLEPGSARAAATLADRALERDDAEAAPAIEQAVGVVVPRARWCRALADMLERAGELPASLAWTQRWLALRPGDPEAAQVLLARVTRTDEPDRLADALGWLLSQAQPAGSLTEPLSRALLRLSELEPARAGAIARRSLDLFGPRCEDLRVAILSVADRLGERGLGIAVRERQLASGAPGVDRPNLLLEVAERRKQAGDADGAARCLLRAVHEGADPGTVLDLVDAALPPRGSDGEVALLEVRAECLSAQSGADTVRAARAWRELGAALWDLAADHESAIAAWERAALLDPERGIATFASDVLSFAGQQTCVERVRLFAEKRTEGSQRARALSVAASVALTAGDAEQALELALASLELEPSRSEVLTIVERAAGTAAADIDALGRAYTQVADAALGRYGERAVHYRAARQMERRGELSRGLGHAVRAFEAVPAQGVTFVHMVRLAQRAGDPHSALAALERVAAGTSNEHEKTQWLERAALISGSGEAGQRQRLEVLLRALAVRPEVETVNSLGETLRELRALAPQEQDVLELRLERALTGLFDKLEGDGGARLAIHAGDAALTGLAAVELGWTALSKALQLDPRAPEYERMLSHVELLASGAAQCGLWFGAVERSLASEAAGGALLAFTSALAAQLGEAARAARLLVEGALAEPDRLDLMRRAERAIADLPGTDRKELERRLLDARSPEERVVRLLQVAAGQRAEGATAEACDTLEQARAVGGVSGELGLSVLQALREVYSALGRSPALASLLAELLERPQITSAERVRLTRDLAALKATRGDTDGALGLLSELAVALPAELSIVEDLLEIAQQAGDVPRQIAALRQLGEQDRDAGVRASALRGLARLLEAQGDLHGARGVWNSVLEIEVDDLEALSAQQRFAEAEADWDSVAQLISRRASKSSSSGARALRLERVRVLDEHLGRPDDARAELELMLGRDGEDLDVICSLARVHEQLGDQLRAAPLWMRATALAGDRAQAVVMGKAACRAYVAAGDLDSARRVLDGMEAWAQSEDMRRLRVEVERRSDSPLGLAEALEELALSSMAAPAERAALLVESAQATERGNDIKLALARAQRAARIDAESAAPQLFARYLEFRARGPGSVEDARITLRDLAGIREPLSVEQTELRAFLLAEALEVLPDPEGAMRELQRTHAEIGARPLIGLGLAERLVRRGDKQRSLVFFDAALSGNLRGLRKLGSVALAAAEAAVDARDLEQAARFLELAAVQPESRGSALLRQLELRRAETENAEPELEVTSDRGAHAAPEQASSTPDRRSVAPLPREEPGPQSARVETTGPVTAQVAEAPPGSERPAIAPPASVPAGRSERPPRRPSNAPPSIRSEQAAVSPADPRVEAAERAAPAPLGNDTAQSARASDSAPPSGPLLRAAMDGDALPLSQEWRRSARAFTPHSESEAQLLGALSGGSVEAGREMIRQLQNRAERARDLVVVARRVSTLVPGDRWTLERLFEAALADKDFCYARAVEHVLSAFAGGDSVGPPELDAQLEQPERVHRMLFGEGTGPTAEALALVWEGAQHAFRRDPGSYGVTGVERVPLHGATPLARVYSSAARLLGSTRTPMFQRRSSGSVTLSVALVEPPAIILSGDVSQVSPELAFHLGSMLGATLPQYVLLFGSTESQARAVIKGLGLAFGPPRTSGARYAAAATLAEVLWESISPRAQRRLRELCEQPDALDYDLAIERARLAIRRAGLYVSGDLRVSVRETCAEEGIATRGLDAPGGLAALCAASPAVSDLILLATSPEYADARWRTPATSRKRPTWSTF